MDAPSGQSSISQATPRRFRLVHVLVGLWFLVSVPLAVLDIYRCWTIRDHFDSWCARHPETVARWQAAGAPQPPDPWSSAGGLVLGGVMALALLAGEDEVIKRPLWIRIALWTVLLLGSGFCWTIRYSYTRSSALALGILEMTEKVKPWSPK